MKSNIEGRVALVTGASRGIGLAICEMLVENGCSTLIMVARDKSRLVEALEELNKSKTADQNIIILQCDFSNPEVLLATLEELKNQMRINIDILINNAGYTAPRTIFEATFEQFQTTINVNLFAPFIIVQELLHGGNKFSHIINIASTAGIKGRAGWSTYSSSKAALIAFSEALREELLPLGTRVTCLSPGRCATDLRRTLAPDEDPTTIMQPEDVAEVAKLMLTDIGHFVDSENIVVRL